MRFLLAFIQTYQQTLRGALRESASGHSVAVGIQIENWTRFRLGLLRGGAIESGKALASKPPPPYVDPGEQDVGIVTNPKGRTVSVKHVYNTAFPFFLSCKIFCR